MARGSKRNGIKRADASALTNADISELLAIESQSAKHHVARAFRRASRHALLWPEEAAQLVASGRSLTELQSVGPYLAKTISGWLADPLQIPEVPELRSGFLTFTEAQRVLAAKPEWRRELRGDLQMHTTWSDGEGSVEQMAEAAIARGYEYIAITDHAKGLKIAGGIDEIQLGQQAEEIARVNDGLAAAENKMRVLRSIELNLNPQGQGDMDSGALARLDIVLGCFHSALRKKEDQTDRYLAALQNPDIQILGHPKGRIYNFRIGLDGDWPRVFALAAELDKAVEIDCYPDRQDLKPELVRLAKQAGCRISLGTDSHGPSQLRFIDFGLASAALAGVPHDRILNFLSREELLSWVQSVRENGAGARKKPMKARGAALR